MEAYRLLTFALAHRRLMFPGASGWSWKFGRAGGPGGQYETPQCPQRGPSGSFWGRNAHPHGWSFCACGSCGKHMLRPHEHVLPTAAPRGTQNAHVMFEKLSGGPGGTCQAPPKCPPYDPSFYGAPWAQIAPWALHVNPT